MLDGIAIKGYRSFGGERVKIPDLKRANIFIGRNNCGKSNVLRFVRLLSSCVSRRQHNSVPVQLDPMLDYSVNATVKEVYFGVQIKRNGFTESIFESIAEPFGRSWDRVFLENKDSMWFDFQLMGDRNPTEQSIERMASQIRENCESFQQQELTRTLCRYTGGSPETRSVDIARVLHSKVQMNLDVHVIDAFRRITDAGGDPLTGAGLIKELRKLQSPQLSTYEAGKARFSRIINFLRSILGSPTAKLEIPAEKDEIYVTLDGKVLPLTSLGTGIHELIIIAAAVTLVDDAIFCIEEPEIHLHPELQKKFMDFILQNTKNQYLIASHSNAFFDLPGVNIYRCWLQNGLTNCALMVEASDKHALLRDLGYRPSDLLQANYVIWVEGPSDRLYIREWIKARAVDLVEGLHYTIMFYGGRLLSHLSFDAPEVTEFVNLAHLNRSACIVMDSDKDNARGRINKTKKRVKDGFEQNACLTWVTDGRTIENYLPIAALNQAIANTHPKTKRIMKWARFEDLTKLRKDKVIDKVAVARLVAKEPADFSILNLDSMLNKLIAEIRRNNAPK